jgi:TonB-dependent receptor
MSEIQKLAKNNLDFTIFHSFNNQLKNSFEKENAHGINIRYDFQLIDKISGNFKFGNKIRNKIRAYNQNVEVGNLDGARYNFYRNSFIEDFNLNQNDLNGNDLPLTIFVDEEKNIDNLFDGKYAFGAVADIDLMLKVFKYFKRNYSANSPNLIDPTRPAHFINQTESQLYDYNGKENYSAAYVMTEIDFGASFNMVAGLRKEVVETTYYSQKYHEHPFSALMYNGEDTWHKRKNTNYMPALFLLYKPRDWLNFRFAITNTLTRPNYTSIIPLEVISGSGRIIDWRNKYLKPGTSKNLDLSLSIHDNKIGFFTAGYFQKKIKNLVFSGGQKVLSMEDIVNLKLDSNFINYTISNYISNNPEEVIIKGFEFDYQTRFWFLKGIMSGFIFNANYSIIKSEVEYPWYIRRYDIVWDPFEVITHHVDTTYTDRLLDQPNEIINFSIGYDKKGFSGRLSMLYYDDVFVGTNFWKELRQTTDSYKRWDMSVKQKIFIDGLSIYLNVSNITDTSDRNRNYGSTSQESGSENIASEQYYGETIDLGFKYSF